MSWRSVVLSVSLVFALLISLFSPAAAALQPKVEELIVGPESAPMGSLVLAPAEGDGGEFEVPIGRLPIPGGAAPAEPTDPVVQADVDAQAMPAPIVSFEGLSNEQNAALYGGRYSPPDTNGDIGPNHYVQAINVALGVFNRSTGERLSYFKISQLWAGFGGDCENNNSGDPIVLYDSLADRWLISQFAVLGPYYQCIAISTTGDPLGSYHRYAFEISTTDLNDYPKFGVWPDGYYMSANMFGASGFAGVRVFAFERAAMLRGQAARVLSYDLGAVDQGFWSLLPSDFDGLRPPAPGAPNTFVSVYDASQYPGATADTLRVWKFHADWANPANATFGVGGQPNAVLNVAPFDLLPCEQVLNSRDCIPQPGAAPDQYLDAVGDRLMYRAQYRNYGAYASLVTNHTVDAGGGRAGIRWYELRLSGAGCASFPCILQQGTYAPADTANRWMGSIAADVRGNIAVGYSVASESVYPSIRYAGRLVTDPKNTLPQAETEMATGGRAQTSTGSRWGDYSSMSVDPVDDCTFWYTNEYYPYLAVPPVTTVGWQTRIASFRFPSCVPPLKGTITGTVRDGLGSPIAGAVVKVGAAERTTGADGSYSLVVAPGTYAATATADNYVTATAPGIAIAAGATVTRDFTLAGAPFLVWNTYTFVATGSGDAFLNNDECNRMLVGVHNWGLAPATGVWGRVWTATPGVTILSPTTTFREIAPGATVWSDSTVSISTDSSITEGQAIDIYMDVFWPGGSSRALWPSTAHVTPATLTGTWSGSVAIPDSNATGASVSVTPTVPAWVPSAATITDVNTFVQVTHTWVGDLAFTLSHDLSAKSVVVIDRPGFGGSGAGCSSNHINATLDDEATLPVENQCVAVAPLVPPPYAIDGTYNPNNPLSAFDGDARGGSWTLKGVDFLGGDVGSITGFAVTLTASFPTGGSCSVPAAMKVLAPNGGEVLPTGSTYVVQWQGPPAAERFQLFYSLNGGGTWKLMATDLAVPVYEWQVPRLAANATKLVVKVVGYTAAGVKVGEDRSDAVSTIEALQITSPNGGEGLVAGTKHTISWRTNGLKASVANTVLTYSPNGKIGWKLIAKVPGNPGSFDWSVPVAATTKARVKVVLLSAAGKVLATDLSDAGFALYKTLRPAIVPDAPQQD